MDFLKLKETGTKYSVPNITDLFLIQQLASLYCRTLQHVTLKGLMDDLCEFLSGCILLYSMVWNFVCMVKHLFKVSLGSRGVERYNEGNSNNLTRRLVTWNHSN